MKYTFVFYESPTKDRGCHTEQRHLTTEPPDFVVRDGKLWELAEITNANLRYNLKPYSVEVWTEVKPT